MLAEELETMMFDGRVTSVWTTSLSTASVSKTAAPEYTLRTYMGFPACTDAVPYRVWHDEPLQGHQAPRPCREPADRAALCWQYGPLRARAHVSLDVQVRRLDAVSMQRYAKFNKEMHTAKFLLRTYPDLQPRRITCSQGRRPASLLRSHRRTL